MFQKVEFPVFPSFCFASTVVVGFQESIKHCKFHSFMSTISNFENQNTGTHQVNKVVMWCCWSISGFLNLCSVQTKHSRCSMPHAFWQTCPAIYLKMLIHRHAPCFGAKGFGRVCRFEFVPELQTAACCSSTA